MKLIACLCWYNESPSWLSACVASLARIGVDHVVAVDGAYSTFPDGRPRSNFAEAQAILMAADAVGIGCTLVQPQTLWYGGEPEKRTAMFRAASSLGTIGEDWLFCIDADEAITKGTERVKEQLAGTDAIVAYGIIEQWWDDVQVDETRAEIARHFPHPTVFGEKQTRFFRIIENLRCDTTHYTYVGEWDGESYTLRGDSAGKELGYKQAEIFTPDTRVVLEHRDPLRDKTRKLDKAAYYEKRDRMGLEDWQRVAASRASA